jgi:hypothetical protein
MPDPMNAACARISPRRPRELRLGELVGDRVEPDIRELADQQVGGDDERRHRQDVLQADPAQRRDLGNRRPGRLADGRTQFLQAELVRAREVARVRREGSTLEIRLNAGHRVPEAGLDRPGQRALRAD